jgi:hypothetical protein
MKGVAQKLPMRRENGPGRFSVYILVVGHLQTLSLAKFLPRSPLTGPLLTCAYFHLFRKIVAFDGAPKIPGFSQESATAEIPAIKKSESNKANGPT